MVYSGISAIMTSVKIVKEHSNEHNVYRCKLEANATRCVLVWLLTRLYFFRMLMTVAMDFTIFAHVL